MLVENRNLFIAPLLHNNPVSKNGCDYFRAFVTTEPDAWPITWYKQIVQKKTSIYSELTRVTDRQTAMLSQ